MDNEQTVDDVASMGEDDPSTLLSDYLKHGAYSPMGEVQEYAEGGEVTGDPLFETFPVRQAAANAYSNPIINQPAVGPTPVGQQPVSIPTALTTPPLPTALSTMQQPQATPTTPGFSPVTTGAATTLSASDMLSNIPTFASTARTLPTMGIAQTPTLAKPVLKAEKDLPKPVINLAAPDILQKYGGTPISFDRPTDVAAYLTPDGLPKDTGGGGGGAAPAGPAVLKTPGGYTYTDYQNFNPEFLSGSKAQITDLFAGVTKQQQLEADAVRQEYNKAVSVGNWDLAGQLKDLITSQEGDVARAKADLTAASKYFTGVGGAYELPSAYRSRREGEFLKQQGVSGYTDINLGDIGFTPETKADPFSQALTTQQKEYNAANSLYGELSKLYGANSEITQNYFNDVVVPQKEQYERLSKVAGDVGKANLYGTITGAAGYKDFSPTSVKFNEIRNEAQTTAAFAPTIKTYETNVGKLTAARDQAEKLGLGGYAAQLNQLLDKENSRLDQARGARQSAIDQAQPDPMRDLILGKQMAAQKITGFSGVDLPDQDYSKLNAAQAFDPLIQRQNADYQAALGTYNQLKALYGDKADVTKSFLNDVVNPQKQELDQANLIKTNANSALGFINKSYQAYSTPSIKIDGKTTEAGVRNVFKSALTNIDNSIKELETAISKHGDQTGVGYYSDALRRKIDEQNAKRDRINSDIDMFLNKIPGRAKGSPPEGEMSNPVARMVAEQSRSKDQGMDSTSKAMLKKFAGGGEAVASSSPTSQEFPLNEKLYATGEARSLESTEKPILGTIGRGVQRTSEFLSAPFGYENPPVRALMDLLEVPATGRALEDVAQGLPTTRGKGQATQMTPNAKALLSNILNVAPAAPAIANIAVKGAKKAGKKIADELGPTAAEMLEKTMPRFNIVPDGPPLPTNMQERVEQGKMFTGRLDSFVSEMQNPVTKEQFLGSLKGKFREYEISRAAQALADLDKAAKITPSDLASRISKVASPNRYKTTIVEPKDSGLHNQYDNVYGEAGAPVGTINLSFEPTAAQLARETNAKEALSTAAQLSRGSIMTLNSIREAVAGEPIKEIKSLTDFVSNMSSLPEATKVKTIEELNALNNNLVSIIQPTLKMSKELESAQRLGSEEANALLLRRMQEAERANVEYNTKGTPFERRVDLLNQIRKDVTEELRRQEFQKVIDKYKIPVDLSNVSNEEVTTVINDVNRKLNTRAVDDLKSIMVDAKPTIDSVLEEAQKTSTYKGSHTAVNSQPNAMGFSRFTDHTVNIPGIGKRDGMHISELQSDMFRDIKKEGKAGGSREADIQEVRSIVDGIKTKFASVKDKLEEGYGGIDSFLFVISNIKNDAKAVSEVLQGPGVGMNATKADQLAQDLVKDIKRVDKLKERVGMLTNTPKGRYTIEEPIASIETQPQVVQQLLIKNAVIGAMQRGKSFISFPGAESKQAKLYEKLPNNLKQVLKDLGEGFEVMPLVLKDKKGVERSHLTLIWDDNTAQRLLNNGVKFKKGGMVEKSAIDNRRYL
jgi:hypothetical protein